MTKRSKYILTGSGAVLLAFGMLAAAGPKDSQQEQERKVKEAEVPKAALAALKKQSGGAEITQFEEEIEHGNKYYEASWKGPNGRVEALVTEKGDLVEIEEAIGADNLPKTVLDAVRKMAGQDAKLFAEKKTSFFYEVKFTKDGKRQEVLFAPDGRVTEQEADNQDDKEESD